MTTVNPAVRIDLEFISSTNRQVDTENQKQAWLRQLESEQMVLLQQLGQQSDRTSADDSERLGSAQHSSTDTPSNLADANLLPIYPIWQEQQTLSPAESAHNNEDLLSMHPVLHQKETLSPAESAHHIKELRAESAAIVTEGFIKSEQSLMEQRVDPGARQGQMTEILPDSTAINRSPTIEPSAAIMIASSTESNQFVLDAKQPPTAIEKQLEAMNAKWEKQMMHVAQKGNEISVSIRDSALTAPQTVQVVSQLAIDAAQNGLRLRQAVVNGKLILKTVTPSNKTTHESIATGNLDSTIFSSTSESQE